MGEFWYFTSYEEWLEERDDELYDDIMEENEKQKRGDKNETKNSLQIKMVLLRT